MKSSYFVMYQRDLIGERSSRNQMKRELYDKIKQFPSFEEASDFALENMHQDPILAKYGLLADKETPRFTDTPYTIVAYFNSKYFHESYDGSSDSVPTHEIIRCTHADLETKLRSLAQEMPNKIYWGIELKLLPETGGN